MNPLQHTPRHEVEHLKKLFAYDPETGILSWRHGGNGWCAGPCAPKPNRGGYKMVHHKGCYYSQHSVAWALMTGAWPTAEIDHINRVKHDNRWSNLREASPGQNQGNRGPHRGNKSGYRGVAWVADKRKFVATIFLDGKNKQLGTRGTAEEAYALYREAAQIKFGVYAHLPTEPQVQQ